jgi:hypothetical protein
VRTDVSFGTLIESHRARCGRFLSGRALHVV